MSALALASAFLAASGTVSYTGSDPRGTLLTAQAILQHGTFALDGGAMFSVVPRVLWERFFRPDDLNRIRLGLNALLVRTGRENILVDTGIGHKWDPRSRDRYSITHETDILSELGEEQVKR